MTEDQKNDRLNEAMQEHGDMIKRVIYSYVRDLQKAEDLTQDTFLKFYIGIESFEGRASLKTYLYRIAVNESLNYLKSWHAQKVKFSDKLKIFRKRASNEDSLLEKEQTSELHKVLESMPLHYRESLWLHYYAELSVNETAEVLGCSPNTVKTRLTRGRELLRNELEVDWHGSETTSK
ncbi:sigma-70 family RNA polymerase sigma factor [Chryseomicrobium sp. FSL W7-1435]|uniref:sigma-70 family RNA polymerase sigma factor n=1 Tax=Chryseomicrobium sp. FSL W7-1435 TaxID=2921704 RepID=UPI00315A9BEC